MSASLRFLACLTLVTAGLLGLARAQRVRDFAEQPPIGEKAWEVVIPSPKLAEVVTRRIRAKAEVIDRMKEGDLTLFEAAGWFRHFNAEPPECSENRLHHFTGNTENERVCRQVISWAVGEMSNGASDTEIKAEEARLTRVLTEHMKQHQGNVILPGWE